MKTSMFIEGLYFANLYLSDHLCFSSSLARRIKLISIKILPEQILETTTFIRFKSHKRQAHLSEYFPELVSSFQSASNEKAPAAYVLTLIATLFSRTQLSSLFRTERMVHSFTMLLTFLAVGTVAVIVAPVREEDSVSSSTDCNSTLPYSLPSLPSYHPQAGTFGSQDLACQAIRITKLPYSQYVAFVKAHMVFLTEKGEWQEWETDETMLQKNPQDSQLQTKIKEWAVKIRERGEHLLRKIEKEDVRFAGLYVWYHISNLDKIDQLKFTLIVLLGKPPLDKESETTFQSFEGSIQRLDLSLPWDILEEIENKEDQKNTAIVIQNWMWIDNVEKTGFLKNIAHIKRTAKKRLPFEYFA
ncbi:hypothetical protein J3R30DRAFT_754773 [Lentinula aciculospora]|uniref:Uncharacterized protein n=1 Tax=Lentinula aciculospora TaxID=153920 RepID=A0A9W9A563_9AGAR|nr:hypothetical protein J3R30DRAFT_754773 [Lentinula aciculospora]